MQIELRNKWTEALRSGKFEQGTGTLRTPYNEFCCLGVLCEVMDLPRKRVGYIYTTRLGRQPNLVTSLPTVMHEELGIGGSAIRHLLRMNDDERNTFKEIADWIELNVEE